LNERATHSVLQLHSTVYARIWTGTLNSAACGGRARLPRVLRPVVGISWRLCRIYIQERERERRGEREKRKREEREERERRESGVREGQSMHTGNNVHSNRTPRSGLVSSISDGHWSCIISEGNIQKSSFKSFHANKKSSNGSSQRLETRPVQGRPLKHNELITVRGVRVVCRFVPRRLHGRASVLCARSDSQTLGDQHASSLAAPRAAVTPTASA
jgi:hypothetical protein